MVLLKRRVVGEGTWSEVVLRNVTGERVGERGKRPAYERICGDYLGKGVRNDLYNGNGKGGCFYNGIDRTW